MQTSVQSAACRLGVRWTVFGPNGLCEGCLSLHLENELGLEITRSILKFKGQNKYM